MYMSCMSRVIRFVLLQIIKHNVIACVDNTEQYLSHFTIFYTNNLNAENYLPSHRQVHDG